MHVASYSNSLKFAREFNFTGKINIEPPFVTYFSVKKKTLKFTGMKSTFVVHMFKSECRRARIHVQFQIYWSIFCI